MNEEVNQSLDALLPALRTLQRALEQIQAPGSTAGSGRTALRHYRLLHEQIARLLPEDHYVTDGLVADVDETAADESLVAQVLLLTQQLYVYSRSLVREGSDPQGESAAGRAGAQRSHGHGGHGPKVRINVNGQEMEIGQPWREFANDYRRFGRELRDQIMQQTRDSLRAAMSSIQHDVEGAWSEWDVAHPAPPPPPVPPVPPASHVPHVPPVPPVPPIPPVPPQAKRRIQIEVDADGWNGPFEDFPDPSDKPPTV